MNIFKIKENYVELLLLYNDIPHFVIFDLEDLDKVKIYKWYYCQGYAKANFKSNNAKYKVISMHSLVLNRILFKDDKVADHINRNSLDNRKNNLRVCTTQQNTCNSSKRKSKTHSIHKGVSFSSKNKCWTAYISFLNKRYYLGSFFTEKDAAIAYNIKAKEFFGKFAVLNIVNASIEEIESVKNKAKKPKHNRKTHKYFGVYYIKNRKKWTGRIKAGEKMIYLGHFCSELEAVTAYNKKASELNLTQNTI